MGSIWKPRPAGFERLRMQESGGRCPVHHCPMFQVYDNLNIDSEAHAIFNDKGKAPAGHICWICGSVPLELADPPEATA